MERSQGFQNRIDLGEQADTIKAQSVHYQNRIDLGLFRTDLLVQEKISKLSVRTRSIWPFCRLIRPGFSAVFLLQKCYFLLVLYKQKEMCQVWEGSHFFLLLQVQFASLSLWLILVILFIPCSKFDFFSFTTPNHHGFGSKCLCNILKSAIRNLGRTCW